MAPPFKALLLCAGTGTRLRPLTDVLPKCLMPINGRPLLGLWLERLLSAGATSISINLHHHAGLVRDYVQRSPYGPFVNFFEEEELLGTGGTLLQLRERLAGGPFLVAHADNLTVFDPAQFLATHLARPIHCVLTMMTFVTETPKTCGIVEIGDKGVVVGFHEKVADPPGNLANAAAYIADDAIFPFLKKIGRTKIDLSTEIIPQLLGRMIAFHNDRYHRDIGTPKSLMQAQLEYPLVHPDGGAKAGEDPWYGLMRSDNHRLTQDFLRAVEACFA
jgi:mannose-1-phosphate guanylyltransferase